ncbi:ornithine cyclodeaminase family protein [Neobacillus sp. YIM B06451]|uniref:ornithine cyclodeaminase family protein n=1 Tax=Neobacillus sp. YIM B06451 TaxID=3070994 RepID=UPI00292FADC8|nr:ornithine cyclodeaminase family protein [Neobacillus sp. YIM B06451]
MLILNENQIRSLYPMKLAIKDMEDALHAYVEGKILNPSRTVLDFPDKKASALYMPSAIETAATAAVKVVTIFPENPSRGMKTTQGVILLTDTENGSHLALLNASYLTRLRTGAASAIATKYLAKEDASTVLVIGCGAMAEEQLSGVLEVRQIKKIVLFNRTRAKAEAFKEKFKDGFSGSITIVDDVNEGVNVADIIICSTRSETPVFSGELVKPGTHINGVGSYLPHMQEVDETTIKRASKIVADTLEGVEEEAGDFIIPAKKGSWSFSKLHGELGELVTGKLLGRENDGEITFFKSVGIAYFDLAVAAAVYKKAVELGIGTEVDL